MDLCTQVLRHTKHDGYLTEKPSDLWIIIARGVTWACDLFYLVFQPTLNGLLRNTFSTGKFWILIIQTSYRTSCLLCRNKVVMMQISLVIIVDFGIMAFGVRYYEYSWLRTLVCWECQPSSAIVQCPNKRVVIPWPGASFLTTNNYQDLAPEFQLAIALHVSNTKVH